MKSNKLHIMFGLLLLGLFIAGCGTTQTTTENNETEITSSINTVQELVLTSQEIDELGLALVEDSCRIEVYETTEHSSLAEFSMCNYTIPRLDNTTLHIILNKYTNTHDLNGSYQYSSLRLSSAAGIISEDEFGDQSRFRKNHEDDYGAEHNDPDVHFYNMWITKDTFLIHITTRGSEEADAYVISIAETLMSKFE
ncbi:MAG: hypothetical protein ACMXYE_02330 [Candidatus Woesearchaeota archaeon]